MDPMEAVTRVIKENPGYSKMEIWQKIPIPQGMSYTDFGGLLEYLLEAKRIAIDSEGHYCWIFNPELTRKYKNQTDNLI